MEHCWISSSSADDIPEFAIEGGYDFDGTTIYVGRAKHEHDLLPAKVIPSKGCAYVPWGGHEHSKNYYEVLVGPGYSWWPCEGGAVPSNAVPGGETSSGEPLFVGRAPHANSLTLGKIHPSHGCIYLPFGGQEISLNTYEVLVCENHDQWISSPIHNIPPGVVVAGYDSDGSAIFLGRSVYEDKYMPAKVVASRGEAYVSCEGSEIQVDDVEFLVGTNYNWILSNGSDIPNNAVFTDRFEDGEPLFVGRSNHCGSLTPGLISARDHCIFIPYGGCEIRRHDFEILVRE